MLLNGQWITEEIKEEMKKYLDKWQWKQEEPKPAEHSVSTFKSIAAIQCLRKDKKISQPNLISKATRERRTNKTQS